MEVTIDVGARRAFGREDAVVVVDVIRSMTTAVSAAALGIRCVPAPTLERARAFARAVQRPLLVGELHGTRPPGFDLTNSPAQLLARRDLHERTVVLLSSSGTPLLEEVRHAGAIYLGCLRNWRALGRHLARHHRRVTLLGAATRGAFREEDQICCAYIASELVNRGFAIADEPTGEIYARWSAVAPEALLASDSVDHLQRTNALDDLDFILGHVDDLDEVFHMRGGEVVPIDPLVAVA
jgi:2-phosphosulfolactate phosphatase